MKDTILLIDGHNMLFRSFFGLPNKIPGKDGETIHGVVGFIGMLLKTLAHIKPTYLLVVFDSETGSFRQKENSSYKENRITDWSDLEANPFSQLYGIRKALDHLSWKHCEVEGVETDDVLSAYVNAYQDEYKLILVSTDSDLLQLVNDSVYMFYPRGKMSIMYTPIVVEMRYGVSPVNISDLKALIGDKTDNVSGIPGIGMKTAQKLISQFGSIENIYKNLDVLSEKIRLKISKHRDRVLKNLSLIKLNQEIELPFNLSELEIEQSSWERKTMQILRKIDLID